MSHFWCWLGFFCQRRLTGNRHPDPPLNQKRGKTCWLQKPEKKKKEGVKDREKNLTKSKMQAENMNYVLQLTYSWPPWSPYQERWGNTAHTAFLKSQKHLQSDTKQNLVASLWEFLSTKNTAKHRATVNVFFLMSHRWQGYRKLPTVRTIYILTTLLPLSVSALT